MRNILRNEQELYQREGLEWTKIDFFDNESICELIDKSNYGIMSIINEPHLSTNEALLQRIQQCCAGHPNFMICKTNSMCFKYVAISKCTQESIHEHLLLIMNNFKIIYKAILQFTISSSFSTIHFTIIQLCSLELHKFWKIWSLPVFNFMYFYVF